MNLFLSRLLLWTAASGIIATGQARLFAQDAPPAAPAPAGASEDLKATAQEKAKISAAFNKYWKLVANKVTTFDNKYFVAPKYDAKHANSNHVIAAQWIKENDSKDDPMLTPPREEGEAKAEYLPQIAPGEYGRVESFKVEKILPGNEFIVSNIWIIDPEKYKEQLDKANIRRNNNLGGIANKSGLYLTMSKEDAAAYNERVNKSQRSVRDALTKHQNASPGVQLRLIGFPLEKPAPNERVTNAPGKLPLVVVIIAEDKEPVEGISSATRYIALPAMRFKTGLNDAQFKAFLKDAGTSPEEFSKLAEEKAAGDPKDWAEQVAGQLWSQYLERNPLDAKPAKPGKPTAKPG
jgi:hypothetical protein